MKELVKSISNLIKVKTIVTFLVLMVFTSLALKGQIPPDNVVMITTSVISFYFGTQHERREK